MTEREIFLAVLDLPDPAARAAYLDRACGKDAVLREKVEGLLRSHDAAGSFLGTPAVERPDPDHAGTMAFPATLEPESRSPADDEVPLGFLAPAQRPDSLGRIGHYEVLQMLGKGGFGIVFRAFDEVLHRVVAVKVLSPQMAATSPARKRFLREARTSAAVRHENVVQVYEVGENPLPYIAMEFIPGETLQQRLDRIGPIEPAEVVRIGRQIAEGLAAAHANDLIHRDIKPANVLLEGGQQKVKITDFGLARAADDASNSQSGIIAGTPMYMAPEQAKGDKLDQRADLFSLGSVLYQMACGRPPFRANSTVAVLKRVAEDTPRDIREIVPETPQWLCDIIFKLHAKNPDERFQSAREVADLLADCEAQLKGSAKLRDFSRIPRSKPVAKSSGRWKWVAVAALLFPVVALAVTEAAGVTHLFRVQHANTDPIKPGGEPMPDPVVKPVTPQMGTSPWTVLKPIEMKSEGGATLTLQPDDSILVSGKLPDRDSYTLTFRGLPATIQTLRLEVLPHDSLPNKGPGRHPEMPFVLSTVRVALEENKGQPRDMRLTRAWADYSAADATPEFAIDADQNTGWCSEFGKPYFIAFELDEPVAVAEGTQLRVTLEFKHDDAQRSLGCFRLSVAKDLGADRKAAEYVLSVGGIVRVEGGPEIKAVAELPGAPFRLAFVGLVENKKVTDAALAAFAGCRNLTELNLEGTPVTDAGLVHFKGCTNLRTLSLPFTTVGDAGLAHFKDCKSLTDVELRFTQVTDAGLAHFKNCTNLSYLNLTATPVTDAGLAHLKSCTNLKVIALDLTRVTDAGLAHLKDCANLTDLVLPGLPIGDDGLAHIKNCKNLSVLNLSETRVTDAGLVHLTGLEKLTELQITKTKVTAKGVEGLVKALPKCKITWDNGTIEPKPDAPAVPVADADRKAAEYVLTIGGEIKVNEQGPVIKAAADLPREAFRLTWVGLPNNKQVTDAGLAAFKDCKNLGGLQLEGTPVTDAGLIHLKDCTSLTGLDLSNTKLTDAGLIHLKGCTKLTYLQLADTQATEAGLAHFKDCKNLMYLNLARTQVGDAGLAQLKDRNNLATLGLEGTPVTDAGLAHLTGLDKLIELRLAKTKVTAKGVEDLAKALPKCKITWDGG